MKDFNDFRKYISENSQEIHNSIVSATNKADEINGIDSEDSMEFHMRAFTENGIMIMLEHYHNWLNQK